jgi:type I restriction enzyme M protein
MNNTNYKLIKEKITTGEKSPLIKSGEEKGYISISRDGSKITYLAQKYTDNFLDPEEQVRAELYIDLIEKYKYKPDKIELEKYRKIGHPHKKTDIKIDIVIYDENHNPFMLFELKSPEEYDKYFESSIKTQLFEVAATEDKGKGTLKFLIYYTHWYDENGKLQEKYETIDYTKYKSFDEWEKAGKPNLRYIPENYGIKSKPPIFIKGGEKYGGKDLRVDVKKEELDRIARNLHNILWSGGKYQNELFFNLIGIFLAKIYDEKTTPEGQPYQFQIFFDGLDQEPPQKTYERINKLYKGEKNPKTGKYSDCALKRLLNYKDEDLNKVKDIIFDAPKVKYVVEILQDISFLQNKYDILGDFFEKIVRQELKQTKGQYLTHPNIVDFILYGLKLDELTLDLINNETRLPYIIDPACGSGTFLIHAMKLIDKTKEEAEKKGKIKKDYATQEFLDKSFQRLRKNAWADEYIYGIEINSDLAMASKVNMVLHGDGSANIEPQDGLIDFENYHKKLQVKIKSQVYRFPVNEQFDVVVSNPPFSVTVDKDTAKQFPELYLRGEKIAKTLRNNKELEVDTETLFIERWYQLLREGGIMGVVLPESVFDTASNRDIRLFIYKYFWIKAVVSLPHLAFAPYTQTKTSILFAQKKTSKEVEEWNKLWAKYEEEYKELSEEIKKLLKSEKEQSKEKFISLLIKLLGEENFDTEDKKLSFKELKEKYKEDIKEVDLEWWVFKNVSKEQDYPIFMAHAEEIGYKRGVRKEERRPNQLFNSEGEYPNRIIYIDTENPKTILDYLRKFLNGSTNIENKYLFKFSDFSREKSLRFDVKFHNSFTSLIRKSGNAIQLLRFFNIVDRRVRRVDLENIDFDNLKYAEIGSCNEYGDVTPFDFSDKDLDINEKERLLKKIQEGDIQKPDQGHLLIPTVRPNLKKFVYIDEDKSDIYFTKAFLCLKPKTNQLSSLLLAFLLRTVLFDTLVGLCREGKGYPTIKKDDLKFFYIDKEVIEKLIKTHNKLLENIYSNLRDIKKHKEQIKKLCFGFPYSLSIISL